MTLADRVRELDLSPGERHVADLVVRDASAVAFGTVASVAESAGVGRSTVMRFANSAGFTGFRELQDAVRAELGGQLRRASERVRRPSADDPVSDALAIETTNLVRTFEGLDRTALTAAARHLARGKRVAVVAGDAARGVAADFANQLGMVRPEVTMVDSGAVALGRALTWLGTDDALVVLDTARYETTVVDAVTRTAAQGVPVVAVSDSHLSPVARPARWSFVVGDTGAGPFDSFVATLALTNLLVALVTRHRGPAAVGHIDALEADFRASRALAEEPPAPG